ncbi:hypothetical protein IFM89_000044 [Coptis chinensis]|uniref:Uncharacterized protein n=1 Tax=Coptis chinensis TaxID=261450 RepID=A0A835IK83_9MAGN|nr:hypothetical protein IFM89_000044 [Coptis chinensis]
MGPGRRTTRSSNAQPQPQPQPMPSSQSADASLGVMESGGRTASSSTLPQSRPNVSVGSSSGLGAAERQAEEYERQAQELTTRLHENEGRVEELQNWKTASEAKLEFLMAHIGACFSVRSGANFSYLLSVVCPPFVECPPPPSGHWPTKHLPAASRLSPPSRAELVIPSFSLRPPPIALAISYGSSSPHPWGCPRKAESGLDGQPLFNSVHGVFRFCRSREILRVFRPQIPSPRAIRVHRSMDGRPSNKKSQREYAAPKIIPSAANVATKLFLWEAPTKMRNSPIKLLVPGELILASGKEGYGREIRHGAH